MDLLPDETKNQKVTRDTRIGIRIAVDDLEKIKAKAYALGLPYQTVLGSILHQYATDRITVTF